MKQKIDRITTGAKSISLRTLAMVLCFVMLLSAIGVGTVVTAIAKSSNAKAAAAGALSKVALADEDEDDVVIGKKVDADLAATGTTNLTIYYTTSTSGTWSGKSTATLGLADGNLQGSVDISLSANSTYRFVVVMNNGNWWGNNSFDLNSYTSKQNNLAFYSGFSAGSNSVIDRPNTLMTASTAETYTFSGTLSGNDLTLTVSRTDSSGGGGETPSGDASGTEVDNANLKAVLVGEKIMFYHGDEWGSNTTKYIYGSSNNKDLVASNSYSVTIISDNNKNGYYAIACEPASDYYISNSTTWGGQHIGTPTAGNAYCIWDGSDGNWFSYNNTPAVNWTVADVSVRSDATTCSISASTSGNTGKDYTLGSVEYYYTTTNNATSSADFYTFNPSNLPTLTAGTTYYIYAAAKDTNGCYVAATTAGTLTVYPALTTPTITIDGAATSSVTASTSDKSTVRVTNKAAAGYPDGTVYKLYLGETMVDMNTTGAFTVSRNSGTAGSYTVVAVAPAGASYSDSAASAPVTLTVTKIAAPNAPTLEIDKTYINVDGKITLTTNYSDYDHDIYDLVIYKVYDKDGTAAAVTYSYDKSFTENTFVDIAVSSATFGNYVNEYAHYAVKAVPKDATVYTASGYSAIKKVKAIKAQWYTYGASPFGGDWNVSSPTYVPINKYYSDEIFYGVFTAANTDQINYRLSKGSGTDYAAKDGTDQTGDNTVVSEDNAVELKQFTYNDETYLPFLYVKGSTTYFVFVEQTTPKVWVRTDLAQITVDGKYLTYDVATDTYSSATDDTTGAYVSVNTDESFVVNKNSEFSVTANVEDDDYEFLGWYSSTTINDDNRLTTSTKLTISAGVTANTTYYPVVRQKTPVKNGVIVESNANATVTASWNGKTAGEARTLKNVPKGASVTVTASANDGYDLDTITWKSADGETGTVTSGSTFTMPASTVTVTVTTNPKFFLWYAKNKTDANPDTDTAWTCLSKADYEYKNSKVYIKIPKTCFDGTNTTLFAMSNSSTKLYQKIWFEKEGSITTGFISGDTTSTNYLTIDKNYYWDGDKHWYARVTFKDASVLSAMSDKDYVLMEAYGTNHEYKYSLVTPDNPKYYNFVAKDGPAADTSELDSNSRYNTSIGKAGDFYVKTSDGSANIGTVDGTTYSAVGVQKQTGVLKAGETYQFCCVTKDSRYYVKAFNVNGVSVKVFDKPASAPAVGSYVTYNYTVPADAPDMLEIEPVYYHYDDSNCVTFYLENYDTVVQNELGWGYTPYIYPFYATVTGATSGGADKARNAFGAYPGSAMVFENGLYEIQIPVTNVDLVSTSGGENGANIKGITINNGYYDLIHRGLMGWSNSDDQYHMQTYDFDDFHKIYEEKNPTNIYFKMKLREDRDNSKEYRHTLDTTLTSTDISDIRDNGNGWELLQDRHNRTIDIFGDPLSAVEAAAEPLYVISTGYVANTAGSYGTAWQIYNKVGNTYTLIQDTTNSVNSIPPSLLFVNNATNLEKTVYPINTYTGNSVGSTTINPGTLGDPKTYETLYTTLKTTYSHRPVMLSYEMNDRHTPSNYGGSGETVTGAWRLDGRWYYTTSGDKISSKIEIEYLDGAAGYVAETRYVEGYDGEENKGFHTGANAFFTDTDYDYYAKRETGEVILDKTKYFSMTAQPADGYEFEGWYIKSDTSYSPMNATDLKKETATVQRSAGQTFVARYKKLTSGNLTINNTATTGTAINGTTYTGSGTAALKIEITEDGTNYSTLAEGVTKYTLGGDYLNDAKLRNANMKLRITASGTASGSDGFGTIDNVYANTSQANNYQYIIQLNKLFNATVVDEQTVYDQQTFTLAFLTYFTAHEYKYEITYTYPSTRLNATQSYKATGTIKSSQLSSVTDATGNLSTAFIDGKKPTESNFMKEMNFTVDSSEKSTVGTVTTFTATAHYAIDEGKSGKVTVTLDLPYAIASRTKGEYDFTAVDGVTFDDSLAKITIKDLPQAYGGFLTSTGTVTNTASGLLTAPASVTKDSETKYFSYWKVTNLNGVQEFNCYNLEFNYRLYDSYIITPVYESTVGGQNIAAAKDYKEVSISYAGTTRNQWNDNGCGAYTAGNDAQDKASDILFNDFEVAYSYLDQELSADEKATCGVILQKVGTVDTDASDKAITDLTYYEKKYADSETTDAETIKTYIGNGTNGGLTLQKYDNLRNQLNNKNRMDFYYASYNSYGWDDTKNAPATNRTIKKNVYRAYAYMTYTGDNTTYLSTPVYFTMYDVANS